MADGIVSNPLVPEVHEHIAAPPASGHAHDGLAWHRHQDGIAIYGAGFSQRYAAASGKPPAITRTAGPSLRATAEALERLHWVERQVIELARAWECSELPATASCGSIILKMVERSHWPDHGETAEDHASELERHARALIAEVLDLREMQHAASSSLAACSLSERGEAHGGHLWRAHGGHLWRDPGQPAQWCPGIRKDPA